MLTKVRTIGAAVLALGILGNTALAQRQVVVTGPGQPTLVTPSMAPVPMAYPTVAPQPMPVRMMQRVRVMPRTMVAEPVVRTAYMQAPATPTPVTNPGTVVSVPPPTVMTTPRTVMAPSTGVTYGRPGLFQRMRLPRIFGGRRVMRGL